MPNSLPTNRPKHNSARPNYTTLANLISEFDSLFPTEKDTVEELSKIAAAANLLKCRHCGNDDVERKYGGRIIKCMNCKEKTWFTAGTLFERARNTRPWVAYIWLLERGVVASSSSLHKHLAIAQSSALVIIKKITTVITHYMGDDAVAVPSALFSRLICKRSRETPARAHPLAEQDEIDRKALCVTERDSAGKEAGPDLPESSTSDQSISQIENREFSTKAGSSTSWLMDIDQPGPAAQHDLTGLSETDREIYGMLSHEPVHVDRLCQLSTVPTGSIIAALTMLELAGLAVRQPDDRYTRYIPKQTRPPDDHKPSHDDLADDTKITINTIIEFVTSNLHGISRKYLQNYLAAFWCRSDRTRWPLGSLSPACIKFQPVTYQHILDYVTPPLVKISAVACQ